jgi:hypothetical protein
MTRTSARALSAARPIIQGLTVLNLLYALGITALFTVSFFIEGWPMKPLGYDMATMHPNLPLGIRAIEIIGLVGAALVHTILRRLLAIVDSVRGGDPFVLDNAQRLHAIAWLVLAIELLRLVVAGISSAVDMKGEMGGFSLAPWLAVLLLFVLAGVFAHGARMRADLEGTV